VFREGTSSAVSSLSLETGASVDLMAQAMDHYVYLITQDTCFTWQTQGGIGTIDSQGRFTAGDKDAQGSIIVSAGDKSVTIPVTVTKPQRYSDVSKDSWYYNAVEYVSEKGLMNGYNDGRFGPDDKVTRAMAVTTLYRMEGSPSHSTDGSFPDVAKDAWYYDAVQWAVEKGIVQGYGGIFDPDGQITREQLAAMFYRYKGSPAASGNLSGFTDRSSVSSWAADAMSWAVGNGIINGMGNNTLVPAGTATRAQLASILMRME